MKSSFVRHLALAGAVVCIILPAHAAARHTVPVTVDGTPQTAPARYVVMVGEGEVKVMPDVAVVSGGVVTRDRHAGDALHDNSDAMAKVVVALKALGVTDKQIATANFDFEPQHPPYDPKTGQSDKIIGYQVANRVSVTLSDLDLAGKVLDALIENGADDSAAINFEIKDVRALEMQAKAEAGKDALKRAQIYAKEVGAELGPVRSISEGTFSPTTDNVGQIESVVVIGSRAASTRVQASEQSVTATVTVVWALK